MYRSDHVKVLKALASNLPKRTTFKTKDIAKKAFKNADEGDRPTRNAYRKLKSDGFIEIVERGEYRLTSSGAAFCRKLEKNRWKLPGAKKSVKKVLKAAPKKVTKKVAVKKAAVKKAAVKKTAFKKMATKAPKKRVEKALLTPAGSNGAGATGTSADSTTAILNF